MHEMSIARGIIQIAIEYAEKEKAEEVKEIDLSIGTLAGIEFDSLAFALDVIKNESILKFTKINIKKIKAKANCLECNSEFEVNQLFDNCPACNSYKTNLICGKEMRIDSLLVD